MWRSVVDDGHDSFIKVFCLYFIIICTVVHRSALFFMTEPAYLVTYIIIKIFMSHKCQVWIMFVLAVPWRTFTCELEREIELNTIHATGQKQKLNPNKAIACPNV